MAIKGMDTCAFAHLNRAEFSSEQQLSTDGQTLYSPQRKNLAFLH